MNFPALLLILDGWGIAPPGASNALSLARLPTFERLDKEAIKVSLHAASREVGLPEGHQGSSEMGHLMIGAGRPVVFPQTQVKAAIQGNLIPENQVYREVMEYCKEHNKTLHLLGLLSDRGVHSYAELSYQLLRLAKEIGVNKVAIHVIADGRDTTPQELPIFIDQLQGVMQEIGVGEIASLVGRYYAMDRDQRWERVEKAYRLYTEGIGIKANNVKTFITEYYHQQGAGDNEGLPYTDEFIPPTLFDSDLVMEADDGVIFWNFRVDRAVEITQALYEQNFTHFPRTFVPFHFVATAQYYDEFTGPVAFGQQRVDKPLGKVLADHQITQLRLAETEKWAYVTKVLDGYEEITFPYEDKMLIPSDKVATYDLRPEMQALAIAEAIVQDLAAQRHQVIIANIANGDMVGHTGNLAATIKAIEVVDQAVALINSALEKQNGFMLITADHGNCERMLTKEGGKDGSHTANLVPLYLVNYHPEVSKKLMQSSLQSGTLTHVAPTFLDLLGVPVPQFMSSSLLI